MADCWELKSKLVAGLLLQAIPQNIFRVSKGTVRGMSDSFGECYIQVISD